MFVRPWVCIVMASWARAVRRVVNQTSPWLPGRRAAESPCIPGVGHAGRAACAVVTVPGAGVSSCDVGRPSTKSLARTALKILCCSRRTCSFAGGRLTGRRPALPDHDGVAAFRRDESWPLSSVLHISGMPRGSSARMADDETPATTAASQWQAGMEVDVSFHRAWPRSVDTPRTSGRHASPTRQSPRLDPERRLTEEKPHRRFPNRLDGHLRRLLATERGRRPAMTMSERRPRDHA